MALGLPHEVSELLPQSLQENHAGRVAVEVVLPLFVQIKGASVLHHGLEQRVALSFWLAGGLFQV